MAYECSVICDSVSHVGVRLTTFMVRFPRFILAEVNTHRMLSRNFESSRAIPVERRIAMVQADPFIPEAFGKNRRGMQASENLDPLQAQQAEEVWYDALEAALDSARELATLGVHKQLANRILEPFAWVTGIITATDWDNFFALRCNPQAQPEFRRLAVMMRDCMDASKPKEVGQDGWHLPLVSTEDRQETWHLTKLSAARCARVSYLTHAGVRDESEDIRLYEDLVRNGHMSPLEHQATPMSTPHHRGNLRSWKQARKFLPNEAVFRVP